jgi:phage terminase large subunit-like protein
MEKYQIIPTEGLPPDEAMAVHRMNSLGSLFYFIKVPLRKTKLTYQLHYPLCNFLERDHIKDVIEWPRDHFKSTMAGEGLVMWRVLPFENKDEDMFFKRGYSTEFVDWMKRKHNRDARNLLISSNTSNAAKLGSRVKFHYESNSLYRTMFPETLPDASCTWTNYSLVIKRNRHTVGGAHGEGTFDFLGVGSALQSRHYNGIIIQDDLVGFKAVESPTVMDKTIDFHKLVNAAFEDDDANHEGDELVIGNRWSYHDLNSHIREHEPWFQITTHSALGGCCPMHPQDTPILPEVFSFEKLMKIKARYGAYHFSCQFLNNPASPENADFRPEWLNSFELNTNLSNQLVIRHEVKDGIVRKDIRVNHLTKVMITDPAHAGNAGTGRCRHAIVVVGMSAEGNYYLLDTWAKACGYDEYFNTLFTMGEKWQIRKVGFETVAGQKFAAYHINFRNRTAKWPLKIHELKGEVEAPDGTLTHKKTWRIRNALSPIFESGRFFFQRNRHQDWLGEYQTFPKGRFVDQLDATAYAPQMMKIPTNAAQDAAMLAANRQQSEKVGVAYTGRIN